VTGPAREDLRASMREVGQLETEVDAFVKTWDEALFGLGRRIVLGRHGFRLQPREARRADRKRRELLLELGARAARASGQLSRPGQILEPMAAAAARIFEERHPDIVHQAERRMLHGLPGRHAVRVPRTESNYSAFDVSGDGVGRTLQTEFNSAVARAGGQSRMAASLQ
jgi:hypothetical protein